MITGCHSIIYSKDAEKDSAFIKDVLGFPSVDAGGGWLIFGLPPSELAVHPGEKNDMQELYLLCDDIKKTTAELKKHKVGCSPIRKQQWGLLTELRLPGGDIFRLREATDAAWRSRWNG